MTTENEKIAKKFWRDFFNRSHATHPVDYVVAALEAAEQRGRKAAFLEAAKAVHEVFDAEPTAEELKAPRSSHLNRIRRLFGYFEARAKAGVKP